MDSILDSAKDVSLLHDEGIIQNALGSDKGVAALFNSISKDATLDPSSSLDSVHKKVDTHCRKRTNKWKANLNHTYFRNPWSTFSLAVLSCFSCSLYCKQYSPSGHPNDYPTLVSSNALSRSMSAFPSTWLICIIYFDCLQNKDRLSLLRTVCGVFSIKCFPSLCCYLAAGLLLILLDDWHYGCCSVSVTAAVLYLYLFCYVKFTSSKPLWSSLLQVLVLLLRQRRLVRTAADPIARRERRSVAAVSEEEAYIAESAWS
ncbi:hypothetical protein RHMOL_Rhmol12G0138400 [Rhododendron molle]|uniref:Uncharacterized protein n=1 Tax=Rhododendron molle TaxID=49168 RepID=A0ACC0LIU8_RHOML|nr:hypothetical protein RHMOL_Rhmol12G0138400 [Rhododendron molle]